MGNDLTSFMDSLKALYHHQLYDGSSNATHNISFKDSLLHIFVEQLFFFLCARLSVAVGLEGIQLGFLQLILTQTWVKCTSFDSSRCVVYSGGE